MGSGPTRRSSPSTFPTPRSSARRSRHCARAGPPSSWESGKMEDLYVQLPGAMLTLFEKHVKGSLFGSSNPVYDIVNLLDLYRAGKLKLDELVTNRYKLEDINQGYAGPQRRQERARGASCTSTERNAHRPAPRRHPRRSSRFSGAGRSRPGRRGSSAASRLELGDALSRPAARDRGASRLRGAASPARSCARPAASPDRVLLYLHGGGYAAGSARTAPRDGRPTGRGHRRAGRWCPTIAWRPSTRTRRRSRTRARVWDALTRRGRLARVGGRRRRFGRRRAEPGAGPGPARRRASASGCARPDLPVAGPHARDRGRATARAARAAAQQAADRACSRAPTSRLGPTPPTRSCRRCTATCRACRRSSCTRAPTTCWPATPPVWSGARERRASRSSTPATRRCGTTSTSRPADVRSRRRGDGKRWARRCGRRLGAAPASLSSRPPSRREARREHRRGHGLQAAGANGHGGAAHAARGDHRRRHVGHLHGGQAAADRRRVLHALREGVAPSAGRGATTPTRGSPATSPSRYYSYTFAPNPEWTHVLPARAGDLGLPGARDRRPAASATGSASRPRWPRPSGSDGRWRLRTTGRGRGRLRLHRLGGGRAARAAGPRHPGPRLLRGRLLPLRPLGPLRPAARAGASPSSAPARPACRSRATLAYVASKYELYQRTPQWIFPLPNKRYTRLTRALARRFPALPPRRLPRLAALFEKAFGVATVQAGPGSAASFGGGCRLHLRRVRDPELRRRLTPARRADVQAPRDRHRLLPGDPAPQRRAGRPARSTTSRSAASSPPTGACTSWT